MLNFLYRAGINSMFPAGLALVSVGVGLLCLAAGVIVGGAALCLMGWVLEDDRSSAGEE